ncbi:hypothetical protein KKI24_30840 [bacterium]|nr:hypothetical protein [bacterium]
MFNQGKRTEVVVTEAEAAATIKDNMTIAIGGLLSSSHPMALIRQIIRNGIKNLTVLAGSAGLELDLLIGAGCVKKVVVALMSGEVIVTVGPMFRKAAESGLLEIWEGEESIYAAGLQAAALGIPFMPVKAGIGTSLPEINPALKEFRDPITNEAMLAVPALKADVALLHAACADVYGNVQHIGTGFGDRALYRASERVIVQVEKIIPNEEIRKNPQATSIPGADMVIRAPFGAHPGSSPGFYLEDCEHMKLYANAAGLAIKKGDSGSLDNYMHDFILEPETHLDYLEKIGVRTLLSLNEY